MPTFLLRIKPRTAIAWQSPSELRFGFDRAEVVLERPGLGARQFIQELRKGIPANRLTSVGRRLGLSPGEQANLMLMLGPVLERRPLEVRGASPTPLTVAVVGFGPLADSIQAALARCGFAASDADGQASFAVLVSRFQAPASAAQPFLTERVPHLSVELNDRSARIGPLVGPDGSPCLTCVELNDSDTNPIKRVLGIQLAHEDPQPVPASTLSTISATVVSLVDRWFQGVPSLEGARLIYQLEEGLLSPFATVEDVSPHTECGCVTLRAQISYAA